MTVAIACENLTKVYGQTTALENLTLRAHHGEILVLIGPSGCGKTTTLRLFAGFEHPTHGTIRLQERVIANHKQFVAPEKRGIGMVFQEHALFPHLTVLENTAFGLKRGSAEQKNGRFAHMGKIHSEMQTRRILLPV